MNTKTEFTMPSATEIQFTRRFAADRSRLWAMWTQARHLRNWWGPKGFTTPVCEVDFKPGGIWFYCMQDAAGQRYCGKMTYDEIDAPNRFSATDVFTDEAGNINVDMPQAHTEIAFDELEGETLVTGISRYRTQAERDQTIAMQVEEGLSLTLDRLGRILAFAQEVTAPRRRHQQFPFQSHIERPWLGAISQSGILDARLYGRLQLEYTF